MTPITLIERRVSWLVAAAAVALIEIVLIATPASYPSYDEAKYIGIGYSFLAGLGPKTAFGETFVPHSPLWSAIVDAPSAWFGADALSWGHLLNAVAVGGLLLLVAWFGWRIRPAVGAAAAAGYAGFPYLYELARTSRLDVPAAALCLAYVVVGLMALQRRSFRWGLAAGLVLGIAFLVKEIALPFAPAPFLVAFARGVSWRALARVLAGVILTTVASTSWWFIEYADIAGRVYRLGTPAWTMVPLVIAAGIVVIGGLWLSRGAAAPAGTDGGGQPGSTDDTARVDRVRRAIAWLAAAIWFALLTVFFQVQGTLQGAGLLQLRQYQVYAALWLPTWPIRLVAALAVIGALLAVVRLVRAPRSPARDGLDLLGMTLLCTFPLVLLVFAVGEPPRNYLAQLGLFIAFSAAGWIWLVDWAIVRLRTRPSASDAAARTAIPADGRIVGAGLAVVLAAAIVGLGTYAIDHGTSSSGTARQAAVSSVAAWVEQTVPRGTAIGFGSFLGYEMALPLRGDWPLRHYVQTVTVGDAAATYGLRAYGSPPGDDWLAIDGVERRSYQFSTFRAGSFATAVRAANLGYLVYATGTSTSVPSLLGALTPDHGFTLVRDWTFPVTTAAGVDSAIDIAIYRVDLADVDLTGSPIFVTASALDRLTTLLGSAGAAGRAAAANLASRVVVSPPDPSGYALLARLRAVAAP